MRRMLFVTIAILIAMISSSIAMDVKELSGTDPAMFDQPVMQKDGVGSTQLGAEVWSNAYTTDNAEDGIPNVAPRNVLGVGLVHHDRMGILNAESVVISAINVINNSMNSSMNVSEES